jgi:poly-gamma-glutamate capsule biosynthesis protein CapA/YwtB (metallophosphatase superfamily)
MATVLVAADWAPIRAFEPLVRFHPEAVYGDLLPVLRAADLRIVNCECALTRSAREIWKSGAVFKGEPGHVQGLTAVPFDVACLANNHVLDYGVAGLRETLRVLHRAGIATVGAGLTEKDAHAPLARTVNGLRVHIVNFSEGEDLTAARGGPGVFGWDIPRSSPRSVTAAAAAASSSPSGTAASNTSRIPRRTSSRPSAPRSTRGPTASSATTRTSRRGWSGVAAGRSSTASATSCSTSRRRSCTGRPATS